MARSGMDNGRTTASQFWLKAKLRQKFDAVCQATRMTSKRVISKRKSRD